MSWLSKQKQFKDLRKQAKDLQNSLAQQEVEGTAEFGKIKVKLNGNLEIVDIVIDASLLSAENQSKIQNGLKSAVNDAHQGIKVKLASMADQFKNLDLSSFGK